MNNNHQHAPHPPAKPIYKSRTALVNALILVFAAFGCTSGVIKDIIRAAGPEIIVAISGVNIGLRRITHGRCVMHTRRPRRNR